MSVIELYMKNAWSVTTHFLYVYLADGVHGADKDGGYLASCCLVVRAAGGAVAED